MHSNPEVVKDLEWLREHGYCQDNLVVGVSGIEHAGRGAFAARSMKKGEVVSPVPLVALNGGRSVLSVVSGRDEDEEEEDDEEEEQEGTKTYQLLYNYMLEHPKSSALFFPAGALSSYINHGGKKKANVKMMWSTKEWSNVEGAREVGVDFLSEVGPVDMILELVATRPIKEGEEVLLDYGNDWEAAWEEHLSQWEETVEGAGAAFNKKSAMALNDVHHGDGRRPPRPFPTEEEEEKDEENDEEGEIAHVQCHILYDEYKIERRRNQDGTRTKVYPWIPHPTAGESRLKTDTAVRGVNRMGCEILERSGDAASGYKYVVRPHANVEGAAGILVKNVPHHAIRYVDKPYGNAQHEATAFRHPIRFPDEIFPLAWRDLDDVASVGHDAKDEL